MKAMVLQTEGLCVNFGKRRVVHDLSLNVEEGTIYGFLGKNGAGKSTTIRVILGLLRAQSGAVRVLGKDVIGGSREPLKQVGSLVEAPGFYDHLTGRDNLRIAQVIRGLPSHAVDEALEMVSLDGEAQARRVGQYSMGMKQRLSLAWALIGKPRVLILDEPINGMDPAGVREIRQLIKGLRDEHGTTIFLSSHILSEVQLVADRIGVIDEGRMVVEKSTKELIEPDELHIKIRCSQNIKVRSRLEEIPWVVDPRIDEDGTVSATLPKAHAANLNRMLVGEGFDIRELAWVRQDLEEYFLSLTGDNHGQVDSATGNAKGEKKHAVAAC